MAPTFTCNAALQYRVAYGYYRQGAFGDADGAGSDVEAGCRGPAELAAAGGEADREGAEAGDGDGAGGGGAEHTGGAR